MIKLIIIAFLTALPLTTKGQSSQISEADLKAFRLILTDAEKRELDRLKTQEEISKWVYLYWKRRDPTPTTERNEYKEEFERRVKYARLWYKAPYPEGFDDRGRIYVKYGEPVDKIVQPIGNRFAIANESWVYNNGLIFDFVEK